MPLLGRFVSRGLSPVLEVTGSFGGFVFRLGDFRGQLVTGLLPGSGGLFPCRLHSAGDLLELHVPVSLCHQKLTTQRKTNGGHIEVRCALNTFMDNVDYPLHST